ncbi:MAG: cell division protein FtsX [Legionellales bacterium]|nr:cell division protein FtsX [Legionellales bacterium]|tara:strand:- start:2016 stop:3029 length:1014 start_codon:yes stop_codon:yes gene_type:complete
MTSNTMAQNRSMPREPSTPGREQPQRNQQIYHHWFSLWASRHLQSCVLSIGRMSRKPFASIMTIAVIGVSLALPMLLFILLQNVQSIGDGWSNSTQISLYLKKSTSPEQVQAFVTQLKNNSDIADVTYVSPEQGLQQFEENAGFNDLLKALPDNPLPPVLVVKPTLGAQTPEAMESLLAKLQNGANVDLAQLDMQWVKRLYALLDLVSHFVWALGILLGIGVLLVVGNTIRLATENHKDEISVIKLVGATNSFVRRPFLYSGFFMGLFGGIFAWLVVSMILFWLSGPVNQLAQLYNSQFHLTGIEIGSILLLLAIGGLLGLLGSFIAVGRHLNVLEA